jgi:hypothetical protein
LKSSSEVSAASIFIFGDVEKDDVYRILAEFDGLIGGSKQFNATAKSLSKKIFKACEDVLKKSIPASKVCATPAKDVPSVARSSA